MLTHRSITTTIQNYSYLDGEDRLVVLNRVARSVVESRRGMDATFVFTYEGRRIQRMLTSGWIRPATRPV